MNRESTKYKYIAGFDTSYTPDKLFATCSIFLFDYKSFLNNDKKKLYMNCVYRAHISEHLKVPVDLKNFIETESILHKKLLEKIKKSDKNEYFPNLILIDGYGNMIDNNYNLATETEYLTGVPTIGIAKRHTLLLNFSIQEIREKMQKCKLRGDYIYTYDKNGKKNGIVMKPIDENTNQSLYISVGNMINLDIAIEIIKNIKVSQNRKNIIPIALADSHSRGIIANITGKFKKTVCNICNKEMSYRRISKHVYEHHHETNDKTCH